MRTISLIQSALKSVKTIRFSNEEIAIDNTDTHIDIYDKKCKWFYLNILKQKAVKAKAIKVWSDILGEEIEWADVCEMKLRNQLEMKIAEFNYKLLNDLLPTGYNLYRWKRKDSTSCIYCDELMHDSYHLLFQCQDVSQFWLEVSDIINVDITWITLALGYNENKNYNTVLSLLCYVIYKKYLIDKQNETQILHIKTFMKKEIQQRMQEYSNRICPLGVRVILQNIKESL